ncbi:carotenoid 1,2-hydratase [Thalassobacter stenotrophicus]|nr:carotenoid 1,2-hydratase [Thalassobacter stenotrophicus]PVZ50478.1 carotenoid 1,2-hydratase [Thalassobacter stenotrophicus]
MSEDGSRAISIIAFIGSVFSPWYRWSGRKDPANHCCINVATYGRGGRWTMTDRGRSALKLSDETMTVGPSSLHWDGEKLVIDLNEISTPHAQRLAGKVTIRPKTLTSVELPLTDDGRHVWRPFAPSSDIEVDLNRPGWRWNGHGYFDSNFGTAALEDDFSYWTWGRYPVPGGSVTFYDADRRDGSELSVAVRFGDDGSVEEIPGPPRTRMARSRWLVRRETRADPGTAPREVKMMLDAPFYSRSAVKTMIDGHETIGVHEALDLNRFGTKLIKPMLAVKVPRRARWQF